MKNIAILYGGKSSEHDVSIVSAAGVLNALSKIPDLAIIPIGIDREGHWYLQSAESQIERATKGGALSIDETRPPIVVLPSTGLVALDSENGQHHLNVDCVFPILHGSYGEDGTVQGLLEIAGIPYVGSGVVGSAVGMDKVRTKRIWQTYNLPVVPYLVYNALLDQSEDSLLDTIVREIQEAFGFPVFIKPNAAGSSVGVSRVAGPDELPAAIERARSIDPILLVEQALNVREIETAVLGNTRVRSFPPGEVVPSHDFYDYEAKYEDPEGAVLHIPAALAPEVVSEVQRISEAAFRAIDGAGLARVDCFVDRDSGSIFLNEINTIPGFTPISMYPKMVEAGGVPYSELLKELVHLAEERWEHQNGREFGRR